MMKRLGYVLVLLLAVAGHAAEVRSPVAPSDGVSSPAAVERGRMIFHDPRLSSSRTHHCGSCHKPEFGWGDGKRVSDGVGGRTTRNSPTLINSGYLTNLFHDKRSQLLEGQAGQPMQSVVELGQDNVGSVVRRFARVPEYQQRFAEVFGRQVNATDMAKAIAAFERTLVSTDAPIDRAVEWEASPTEPGKWFYTIQPAVDFEFTPEQRRGFDIFFGRGGCIACHHGPDYRHDAPLNNGMGFYVGFTDDSGREGISDRRSDLRAFAVPTLRELARTGPYGHAGHLPDLRSVADHYSAPPVDPFRDARVQPLNLSDADKAALTAFLSTAFQGRNYPDVGPPAVLPADPPGTQQVQQVNQNTGRRGLRRGRR